MCDANHTSDLLQLVIDALSDLDDQIADASECELVTYDVSATPDDTNAENDVSSNVDRDGRTNFAGDDNHVSPLADDFVSIFSPDMDHSYPCVVAAVDEHGKHQIDYEDGGKNFLT